MKIKHYRAPDMRQALRQVRDAQGPDAVILSSRKISGGVEIVAAVDYDENASVEQGYVQSPLTERPVAVPPASYAGGDAYSRQGGSVATAHASRAPQGADYAAMAKRLASEGYSAYVLAPAGGTPAVYRVRVGTFDTRREAETVAAKLEKEKQFKPWVTR